MQKKLVVLSFLIAVILLPFTSRDTFASTQSSMDVATLYWIYFGKPLPVSSTVSPTMRIPTPTIVIPSVITPIPIRLSPSTPSSSTGSGIKTSPTVTLVPTNTPTPRPTAMPTPTNVQTQPVNTSSVQDYIMQQVNEYRASQGLSGVKTDHYTCDFASVRAGEIVNNFDHDGFNNRISSHTLPYPSYHQITENIAETSDYHEVVTMWKNSPGHAANMRADTPYICVAQSGNYFAFEGWKP